MGLNKVILQGNLTRDPELRDIGNDRQVVKFSIAVNRRYKTMSGEQQEEVAFIDCEMFGNRAKAFADLLEKGKPVLVEGRLKMDQWQTKEGEKRSKLNVLVENFELIDGGGGKSGGGKKKSSNTSSAPQEDHSDIPF